MSGELPIQMQVRKGHGRSVLYRGAAPIAERTALCLRLPPALLDKLDAAASAGYRSRNAEIQRRLEASVENESVDEHGVIVVHVSQHSK